ncbi:MAG: DUF4386 domain-containing protein [Clostridia bacterium]|nr:DUF4386 domain-containing protein [Clostridia bacterium]
MENSKQNNMLLRFFGITLFTQAITSLVGGMLFLNPFASTEVNDAMLSEIASLIPIAYSSMVVQMITAIVIIMLGVAMYRLGEHKSKTLAAIALSMYIFEAILLASAQVFAYALVEVSKLYAINGDTALFSLGHILFSCKEFAGKIAMLPFGIGAVLFYYLMTKARVFPKWMGIYGMITVTFIGICMPLMAFNVDIPFAFCVPYVPFEFVVGIYLIIKHFGDKQHIQD